MPSTNIMTFGGGTGQGAPLRALVRLRAEGRDIAVTAGVSIADSGGSSGVLRETHGVLPYGDYGQCALALRGQEDLTAALRTRLPPEGDMKTGHSIGNLMFAELERRLGREAVLAFIHAMLGLPKHDRVLPVSLHDTHLLATTAAGETIDREHLLDERVAAARQSGAVLSPITSVRLDPVVPAYAPVLEAIAVADVIILPPGNFFASVAAALLPTGIGEAIARCSARIIQIVNIVTIPGETAFLRVHEYPGCIKPYLGGRSPNVVLYNTGDPHPHARARYAHDGQLIVPVDEGAMNGSIQWIGADLVDATNAEHIRHDPGKLARALHAVLFSEVFEGACH